MPQVTTGWEPTDSGWSMVDERVFEQASPGTQVISGHQDFRFVSVAGIDVLNSVGGLSEIAAKIRAKGKRCYYLSLWRNPPGWFVGYDDYRVVTVSSA